MVTVLTPSFERVFEEESNFESLLANISSRFVNIPSDQLDREIGDALRVICRSMDVEASCIYRRQVDNPDVFELSYTLRDPNLPPPPATQFTAAENFPWCNQKLIANEIICLPDIEAAPPEASIDKAMWRQLGIYSALAIPLSTGGRRPVGFWAFDSTSQTRDWPEPLQKRLKILADVFANALERAETERRLLESEARLRLAANTTGAGLWTIDVERRVIWATPKLKELLGFKPDGAIDARKFFNIVHPADRGLVQKFYKSMVAGHEETIEYRIVPTPGSIRWVVSRGNPYEYAGGTPLTLMGVTLDITERRTTEEALRNVTVRLLQAQEEERRRIARELHDSIGQRVAMIAMGIQQLGAAKLVSAQRDLIISQLGQETLNLSSEIQALSHGLHSPQLDFLGLEAAIEAMCCELRGRHDLDIQFTHEHVPKSLPPDVALALFRITQEGLQNALKHSGVKRFVVWLEGAPKHIRLTIRDSGVGFDVKKAVQGRGLGLISMRERALALKGSVKIRSQPGRGTEILVSVPVDAPPWAN